MAGMAEVLGPVMREGNTSDVYCNHHMNPKNREDWYNNEEIKNANVRLS